jgi:hypothetical protein
MDTAADRHFSRSSPKGILQASEPTPGITNPTISHRRQRTASTRMEEDMKKTHLSATAAAILIAASMIVPASAQMSGESPNPSEAVGNSTVTEQLMRNRVKLETMSEENDQLKRIIANLLTENEKLKNRK